MKVITNLTQIMGQRFVKHNLGPIFPFWHGLPNTKSFDHEDLLNPNPIFWKHEHA